MNCNKKEWQVLDEAQAVLLKFAPLMNEKDIGRVNALIYLCADSTKAQRANRQKAVKQIQTRRKTNPQYCRNYILNKESARAEALKWLEEGKPTSKEPAYFMYLANLYGLKKEFKKLGII